MLCYLHDYKIGGPVGISSTALWLLCKSSSGYIRQKSRSFAHRRNVVPMKVVEALNLFITHPFTGFAARVARRIAIAARKVPMNMSPGQFR